MKNKSYTGLATFGIADFALGLLLNIVGVLLYCYTDLKEARFHFLTNLPLNIIIIFSPVYLSILLGFLGFKRKKSLGFKHLAKIFTQVDEAIILCDSERNVQWVNDGFKNIHGYALEEIKGKKISDIVLELGPLSNKGVGLIMLEKLLKGEAVTGDLLIYHKNGEPIWVSISIKPILDKVGNTEGYIAIHKNISIRKAKEMSIDALYKEIGDYKFALDQASPVLIFDLEGNVLRANNNFCIKNDLAESKIVGRNISSINSSMGDYNIATPIWDALYEGLTWKGELINRNLQGKTHWAYTTIVPLLDIEGNPHHFLSIEKDITERKKLEAELETSKK